MKKVHILLVEDNEGDIFLTLEAFEESDFKAEISVVRNGRDAMDFLFKRGSFADVETPELILLDLNLPIYNGIEVLQMIKADSLLKKIPVIILTTSPSQIDINKAFENKVDSYIVKPLDLDEFFEVILEIEKIWLQISKKSE